LGSENQRSGGRVELARIEKKRKSKEKVMRKAKLSEPVQILGIEERKGRKLAAIWGAKV